MKKQSTDPIGKPKAGAFPPEIEKGPAPEAVSAPKPAPARAKPAAARAVPSCDRCHYWLGKCKARDLIVNGHCGSFVPKPRA